MVIPHDVIANGESGIEGDTRSARGRVQLRHGVTVVMWKYARRVDAEYVTDCFPAAARRHGRVSLIHSVATLQRI